LNSFDKTKVLFPESYSSVAF